MLSRTVPAIGFFLPCAAIWFAPPCFLCELKRVLSQAAVCCLCSTAAVLNPTFKSLLPAFLLLPFGEVRGRGEGGGMPAFAVCSMCLGGARLRLVAFFGGGGGRELALGMPLGVLVPRPGACLLGPRGLLQMAVLVALIGSALSLSV